MAQESFDASNMSSSVALLKVAQNDSVLRCAQNYLKLYESLKNDSFVHSKEVVLNASLPSDLNAVERGVLVLCSVYAQAQAKQNKEVCTDISNELKKIAGFYQRQVSQAYFSASNILFDAADFKPEMLKKMHHSRDALKQVHFTWPTQEDNSNLVTFFEKVDAYSRSFDTEMLMFPERRSGKASLLSHFVSSHQRCA